MLTLESRRIRLINASEEMIERLLDSDQSLADFLEINIPDKWSEFGDAPFKYVLNQIQASPGIEQWWCWLPILKSENMLVGNCGYKGPQADGIIEIGYEVAEAYRGNGLATEMAETLIENAKSFPEIKLIRAHTLPEENASVAVLRKCGFTLIESTEDPEDGIVWRWQKNL